MTHRFGAACFADVALNESGGGILIMREGDPKVPGYVVVLGWIGVGPDRFHGLHEAGRWGVGGGSPAFCKAYQHDGLWWVAYHDGVKGQLRCLTTNQRWELEPCENNEPIVFGAGCVAFQGAAADGWPITVMALSNGEARSLGHGRGTGLAYLAQDRVVLNDENRSSVPGLVNPVRASGLIVGEDPDPNNHDNLSLLWSVDQHHGRLWPDEPCLTPRDAVAGPWLGITTWGQGADVRLFVGTLADLIAASAAPSPVPIPRPIPEPSTMRLPDAVQSTLRALWPKVQPLHAGSDDERRDGTRIMIEQVVFSHPGHGYGWKSADPGRPPSKDAMAQQVNGRLFYIDLVNGSTRALADLTGELGDITGQHFIPVAPVNHLGAPAPVPVPPGRHVYDGGENDTGECDRCGQPRSGPLHIAAEPEPEPEPNPLPGVVTNAQIMAQLKRLSDHLGLR